MPIDNLALAPFVTGEKGTATGDFMDHPLPVRGVEPDVAVEVRQRGRFVPIVVAGGGVSNAALPGALDAMLRGALDR